MKRFKVSWNHRKVNWNCAAAGKQASETFCLISGGCCLLNCGAIYKRGLKGDDF